MVFFDTMKFRRISTQLVQDRNGAKSYEWTPDSRHFITSVLRPWRRVDNGFKVFTYTGELVHQESFEELFQVAVQPPPTPQTYPNLPMSPATKARQLAQKDAQQSQPEKLKAATSYVPPHLRGKQGAAATNTVAQSLARQQVKPTKLNAAKPSAMTQSNAAEPKPAKVKQITPKKVLSAEELSKKVRATEKKLREINELKAKLAQGAELNEAQQAKLLLEDKLTEDLAQLQINT